MLQSPLQSFLADAPTPYILCEGAWIIFANAAAHVLFQPDDAGRLEGADLRGLLLQTQGEPGGAEELFAGDGGARVVKCAMRGGGGRELFVEIHASPVSFDGQSALLLACFDQTAGRRVLARLEQSEQRFRDVADGAGAFVWEVDTRGRYTFLSEKAADILGRSLDELLGRCPLDFVPPEDAAQARSYSDAIAREAEPFREFEHRITRGDGSIIWISVSGIPLIDARGNWTGYRGASIDVTHRHEYQQAILREKESAQAADRAKSEFLAVMSHEIRTPLNSVLGFSELLAKTSLDEHQQEFVETIRYSGDALLALVNDILDYSKVEAGKLELEMDNLEVRHFCEEVLRMNAMTASEKRIELYCTFTADVPHAVSTDPTRFRQILLNLVSNAVKFTTSGEVEISATCLPSTSGRRMLRFAVRDTGIGIKRSQQAKLFQPFSQADSSTTRRFGGTGLGLAISRGLAEFLGGRLHLLASSPMGSTFCLDLPVSKVIERGPKRLKGKTCAVIESHSGLCESIALALEHQGATVSRHPSWLHEAQLPAQVIVFGSLTPETDAAAEDHPVVAAGNPILLHPPDFESRRIRFIRKPILSSELTEAVAAALGMPSTHQSGHGQCPAPQPVRHIRVLVVEDNEVNRRLVEYMLKRLGYLCDTVGSGLECLHRLETHAYDLILMDVQMPDLSGIETARRIRARENKQGAAHRVRIVALTAAAMEGDRQKCLDAGMDDYLSKPIRIERLRNVLDQTPIAVAVLGSGQP